MCVRFLPVCLVSEFSTNFGLAGGSGQTQEDYSYRALAAYYLTRPSGSPHAPLFRKETKVYSQINIYVCVNKKVYITPIGRDLYCKLRRKKYYAHKSIYLHE